MNYVEAKTSIVERKILKRAISDLACVHSPETSAWIRRRDLVTEIKALRIERAVEDIVKVLDHLAAVKAERGVGLTIDLRDTEGLKNFVEWIDQQDWSESHSEPADQSAQTSL
jgi:hypothetical protein